MLRRKGWLRQDGLLKLKNPKEAKESQAVVEETEASVKTRGFFFQSGNQKLSHICSEKRIPPST
jgi:hypothetical protein